MKEHHTSSDYAIPPPPPFFRVFFQVKSKCKKIYYQPVVIAIVLCDIEKSLFLLPPQPTPSLILPHSIASYHCNARQRFTLTWFDIFSVGPDLFSTTTTDGDGWCSLLFMEHSNKCNILHKKRQSHFEKKIGSDEMGFDDDDADTAAMVVVMIMQNVHLFWCLGRRAIFQKIDFYTSHNIKTKLLLCCKGSQTF